eukprot:jgi/Ulvmu1/10237/UM060_0038.1
MVCFKVQHSTMLGAVCQPWMGGRVNWYNRINTVHTHIQITRQISIPGPLRQTVNEVLEQSAGGTIYRDLSLHECSWHHHDTVPPNMQHQPVSSTARNVPAAPQECQLALRNISSAPEDAVPIVSLDACFMLWGWWPSVTTH